MAEHGKYQFSASVEGKAKAAAIRFFSAVLYHALIGIGKMKSSARRRFEADDEGSVRPIFASSPESVGDLWGRQLPKCMQECDFRHIVRLESACFFIVVTPSIPGAAIRLIA